MNIPPILLSEVPAENSKMFSLKLSIQLYCNLNFWPSGSVENDRAAIAVGPYLMTLTGPPNRVP